MSRHTRLATLLLAIASAAIAPPSKAQVPTTSKGDVRIPDRITADSLRIGMRKLWVSNAIWMREYIVNTIEADPSLDAATVRLASNQQAIGYALATFYGTDVGNQVTTLLRQHSELVSEMIAAVRDQNSVKLKQADSAWVANANQLATVLGTANPNWPFTTTQPLLADALSQTAVLTKSRLDRDYNLDVQTFDRILERSLQVADAMSAGIIAQFPSHFNK